MPKLIFNSAQMLADVSGNVTIANGLATLPDGTTVDLNHAVLCIAATRRLLQGLEDIGFGSDAPINGADAVDSINELYADVLDGVLSALPDMPAVTYLTNACGEETGYGDLDVTEEDLSKVPFENGPGYVLPYIVQIDDEKFVLGNLEVGFNDEFWGEDRDPDTMSYSLAVAYCNRAEAYLAKRLPPGAKLIPAHDDMPGRLVIGVALPLAGLSSIDETSKALESVFGKLAELPDELQEEPV